MVYLMTQSTHFILRLYGVGAVNEVQKLLDEDPNLDEDQADTLKATTCLLAVAVVKKAEAKARKRVQSLVWVRGGKKEECCE